MKVFDLQCDNAHVFEGWFQSRESFDEQIEQAMILCPVCQSSQIERKLSAARINTGAARPQARPEGQKPAAPTQNMATLQGQVLQQLRSMLRQTDNVGERFAQEARRMHEGDIPARPIRGQASAQECQSLLEDGIEVMAVPDFLDDDNLQ